MAAVLERDPEPLLRNAPILQTKREALISRLGSLQPVYETRARDEIVWGPGWEHLASTGYGAVLDFVQSVPQAR